MTRDAWFRSPVLDRSVLWLLAAIPLLFVALGVVFAWDCGLGLLPLMGIARL